VAYPWNAGDVVTASDLNDAIANAGGGGGGASVTVSDTAPSSPSEGDLWFESDTGDILVYYGSAWVDVGGTSVANIAVQSTAPTEPPVNGDLWFDTDTAQTFVWYDDGTSTQWVEVGAASAAASGTDGAVQFASGGALSSDASNLVWDDTNNRLGIGTTAPAGKLHISDSNPTIWLTDTDTNADSYVSASSSVGSLILSADENNEVGSSQMSFKVDGTERVTILSNGNIGINDTTPSHGLDVNGDINTTGAFRTDGKKTGLVLLTSGDVSSGGPITFTSLFSSEFDNYIVYLSELTCTGQNAIYYRTASSGSWNTSSVYSNQRIYGQSTSVGAQRFSSTYAQIGYAGARESSYEVHFFSPYLSTQTSVMSRGAYSDNTNPGYIEIHHSYVDNTTSYDGFVFDEVTGAASISCRYEVYGIPK
jgi:hypothetical protein